LKLNYQNKIVNLAIMKSLKNIGTLFIEKNKINNLLFKHYVQLFFIKFKLNAFINT